MPSPLSKSGRPINEVVIQLIVYGVLFFVAAKLCLKAVDECLDTTAQLNAEPVSFALTHGRYKTNIVWDTNHPIVIYILPVETRTNLQTTNFVTVKIWRGFDAK